MSPLKCAIVTQEDPFYIAEFFKAFLQDPRGTDGQVTFVGAWILHTLGQKSGTGLLKRMYGLYGPLDLTRLLGRFARKKINAKIFDSLREGTPVTVRQVIGHRGIPVVSAADINSAATRAELERASPDVILSISATQKFGPDVLAIPRLGCFNSHSGALPRFRGMMPTFWTLYEDEPQATVTIHKMAANIDDGSIWRQESIPLSRDLSLDDVIIRTKRLSARMAWDLLYTLAQGEDLGLRPNDSSQKTYYRFPTARDSSELRKRGWRLL